MAFTIEQKIKGRIYLYEVEKFWDKEKKQSKQKRKYLGPKERIYKSKKANSTTNTNEISTKPSSFVSKSYGDTYLTRSIQKELGLIDILKKHFKENYKEILALSAYAFQESLPSYLFPFWHEDHKLNDVKKMNSQTLSSLYEQIGRSELERIEFLKSWGKHINPTSGIYYDITSISSYSTNNEDVEWGYNRDNECLPQINIGFTYCSKTSLPLSYNVHSGSIVDVSTLKNTIKRFNIFDLKNLFFILDRGFFSVSNVQEMCKNKMSFIQPLPFSLKKAKELVTKHKSNICSSKNAFRLNKEIIYHAKDEIEFEKTKFSTHLFFNEKMSINYKHYLYNLILEIEEKIKPFKTKESCEKYYENDIQSKYKKYFRIEGKSILRNEELIEDAIFRSGMSIFIVHGKSLSSSEIIKTYRNRDKIEKEISSLKHQIDTKRLRTHNKDTTNGRLFVKFIALIQHSKILSTIKNDDKLKNYSLNEIMSELKKLKLNYFGDDKIILTELTKKQKLIFKAFNIDINNIDRLPGY